MGQHWPDGTPRHLRCKLEIRHRLGHTSPKLMHHGASCPLKDFFCSALLLSLMSAAHLTWLFVKAGNSGGSETSQVILYLCKQNEVLQTGFQLAEHSTVPLRSEA